MLSGATCKCSSEEVDRPMVYCAVVSLWRMILNSSTTSWVMPDTVRDVCNIWVGTSRIGRQRAWEVAPFIGNYQETCGVRTGWGAVILAEVVALIAAGTVHRVSITTCFLFSAALLYEVNKLSGVMVSRSESRGKRMDPSTGSRVLIVSKGSNLILQQWMIEHLHVPSLIRPYVVGRCLPNRVKAMEHRMRFDKFSLPVGVDTWIEFLESRIEDNILSKAKVAMANREIENSLVNPNQDPREEGSERNDEISRLRGYKGVSYKDLCMFPSVNLPLGFKTLKFEKYDRHGDPVYNVEMIPDKKSLANMKKKTVESFKEYAIRWREQAAGLKPLMKENKLVEIFIQSQDETYF
ncbi:putative TBC1 domain family member 22B-like [Capsicum annuum]|nr:putative TBC1 domain family member 22B-like [Capsicum annuum]